MSARPIPENDYQKIKLSFKNLRDRCLFVIGYKTGFRISELLSLQINDVYKNGIVNERLKVTRRYMKGKIKSRDIILDQECRNEIALYMNSLVNPNPNAPLFQSRQGVNDSLSRKTAHVIYKKAFENAGVSTDYSTHSCRKAFSLRVFKASGNNLPLTQKAMGHSDINTTIKYLPIYQDEIDSIISPKVNEDNTNVIQLFKSLK